jgi:hypothetical protein
MLYRKSGGSESKLSYLGHVLMENRNGLVVNTRLTKATGTAERDAALDMAGRIPGGTKRVTLGGDKNYDTRDFVSKLREAAVTPHVAQNQHARRTSAIDERTTRHEGYAISQRKRKRVEEILSSLVRNVPGVTSIEVSPFWAVGDGPGFLLCKWFLPCCRRLSGRWESGNPAFGFPFFHGPTVSNSCFRFPHPGVRRRSGGNVVISRRLRDFQGVVGRGGSLFLDSPLSTRRHFHGSLFIR